MFNRKKEEEKLEKKPEEKLWCGESSWIPAGFNLACAAHLDRWHYTKTIKKDGYEITYDICETKNKKIERHKRVISDKLLDDIEEVKE